MFVYVLFFWSSLFLWAGVTFLRQSLLLLLTHWHLNILDFFFSYTQRSSSLNPGFIIDEVLVSHVSLRRREPCSFDKLCCPHHRYVFDRILSFFFGNTKRSCHPNPGQLIEVYFKTIKPVVLNYVLTILDASVCCWRSWL